jgi:preprotein translocase subunit SecF
MILQVSFKYSAKTFKNQSFFQDLDMVSRKERRLRRYKFQDPSDHPVAEQAEQRQERKRGFYDLHYKKLLIIPFIILILAIAQIGFQAATTGDFINRGISLKGGITVTIPTEDKVDLLSLEDILKGQFEGADVSVRKLTSAGKSTGVIIDADVADSQYENFVNEISMNLPAIPREEFSTNTIGSSLGKSFFKQTLIAVLLAFIFMGIVIFLYFKTPAPSLAVILAAFSDIVITLAIVNLLGIKLSTAGIAAFLMLIGYSVDTDVLLTSRILKRKSGSVLEGIYSAMKTGILMNVTTLVAVCVGLIVAQSEVIRQIMIILFIGILVDMMNTWIQNAGLLRMMVKDKKLE